MYIQREELKKYVRSRFISIKRRFEAIGNVRRAENIFDRESLSILTNSTAD